MLIQMMFSKIFHPSKLIIFGLLIWSFFQIKIASTILIILIILAEGHQFLVDKIGKPKDNLLNLPDKEFKVLQKYHIYFSYPFVSKQLSSMFSAIQLLSFVWVPWLAYNHYWWQAIFIIANYLVAAHFAFKLNPRFFLHDAVDSRKITDFPPENFKEIQYHLKLEKEMIAVDSLVKKIFEDKICLKK